MRSHVISSRLTVLLLICLVLLTACGGQTVSPTVESTPNATATPLTDFYGTPVSKPQQAPKKIVSLAPSTSEILAALNLQDRVVGVDSFTDYPADMASKPKISDATSAPEVEKIVSLQPDLVLGSGGFTKSYIAKLREAQLNVVDLKGATYQDAINQILAIGQLTHTETVAQQVVDQMEQEVEDVQNKVKGANSPKVLLLVDYAHSKGKPYVYGGGSFGDELLQKANATNIFHENTESGGYPQVTDEAILTKNPEYVILTELPTYGGFKADDIYALPTWNGVTAVKDRQVHYVNSNLIQRPGPRLSQALRCIAQIVHPDTFSDALPAYCTVTA